MKEHGLASVDDLWFVFYGRVEQILKAHGIPLSGWEEIAVRKTRRDGQADADPEPGVRRARLARVRVEQRPRLGRRGPRLSARERRLRGRPVPRDEPLLRPRVEPEPGGAGLDWGGFVDLRKPFQFIPFDYYRNARLDRRSNPLDPSVFAGRTA